MDWKRMGFRGNKVWLAVEEDGNPKEKNGKVLIKYQLDQDYEYWVRPEALRPLDGPQDQRQHEAVGMGQKTTGSRSKKICKKVQSASSEIGERDAVRIYTDGASSGNPGPSGIGVVMLYGDRRKEISEYIGSATNNVAELEAIRRGLLDLKKRNIPVRIYTDSAYVHGLLTLEWKPRKNRELVEALKEFIEKFHDIQIIKVKGHAGHPENERADFLATSAAKSANR